MVCEGSWKHPHIWQRLVMWLVHHGLGHTDLCVGPGILRNWKPSYKRWGRFYYGRCHPTVGIRTMIAVVDNWFLSVISCPFNFQPCFYIHVGAMLPSSVQEKIPNYNKSSQFFSGFWWASVLFPWRYGYLLNSWLLDSLTDLR